MPIKNNPFPGMRGAEKKKAFRRLMHDRAVAGIGHDFMGQQKPFGKNTLGDSLGEMATNLQAGCRVGEFARGRHRPKKQRSEED